jgi:hypothetical protein
MRTVKTTSGAIAVQVVWSSRRGLREIEHLGSAHDEAELEALKAAAQQRIAAGQLELNLGLEPAGGGPLPITSSRKGHLLDALGHAYRVLGLEDAAGGDDVFRHLVTARIIEPVSKLDSLRVLEEAGVAPASYATVKRRLPEYAPEAWRQRLSAACAAHARLGPASLVLYDVSTLYHRKRDSIEAHLTIVFAALAVSRWIEAQTGWSIRRFVKAGRRYRTIEIQAGRQTITAADPLPDDLRGAPVLTWGFIAPGHFFVSVLSPWLLRGCSRAGAAWAADPVSDPPTAVTAMSAVPATRRALIVCIRSPSGNRHAGCRGSA